MFDYVPDMFRAETADSEDEADKWYDDHTAGRRPPELLPRDEVARSINSEVKAGRGSPHGGVFLDIATRRTAEDIRRRLPSMYHQFKELAGVDITAEAMEVGPDLPLHHGRRPGRRRLDGRHRARACSPPARWPAACTAPTASAATRSPTSWSSAAGPGSAPPSSPQGRTGDVTLDEGQIQAAIDAAVAPFEREGGENPYDIQHDLQETMQSLVGIIRTGSELEEALGKLEELEERAANVSVTGGTKYNPGWNLATDLPSMLTVSRCTAMGALDRKESRGGQTRDDFPTADPEMGKVNFVERIADPSSRRTRRRRHPVGAVDHQSARAGPGDAGRAAGPTRGGELMAEEIIRSDQSGEVTMRIWRGDEDGGEFAEYVMPAQEGEVVLDVIHRVQATEAPDLACRWNCKAGKCGSCSAEINGRPSLMCMTRMDTLPVGETVTVAPMRAFPIIRDLVTDVSYNYEVAKRIPPLSARAKTADEEEAGGYRMAQIDVERSQEFRKCIECFLCQDVCHVVRDHEENKTAYAGPRFFIRSAELEMHPLDTNDRRQLLQEEQGLGKCNITKCCTEVCPEHIKITDNAIIPLKERVVDAKYDPVAWLGPQDPQPHQAHRRGGGRRGAVQRTGRRPAAGRGARHPPAAATQPAIPASPRRPRPPAAAAAGPAGRRRPGVSRGAGSASVPRFLTPDWVDGVQRRPRRRACSRARARTPDWPRPTGASPWPRRSGAAPTVTSAWCSAADDGTLWPWRSDRSEPGRRGRRRTPT